MAPTEVANLQATIGLDPSDFLKGAAVTKSSIAQVGSAAQKIESSLAVATARLRDMETAFASSASHTETQTVKLQQQREKVEQLSAEYQKHVSTASAAAAAQAKMSGSLSTLKAGLLVALGASKQFNEAFGKGFQQAAGVASAGFGVLTGQYEKLGSLLGALPGPIGVVAGALGTMVGQAISDTSRYADTVDKLSQKIGESAQFASSFIEAADDMRVSQDTVSTSLSILSKNLGGVLDADSAAATGGRGLTAVFQEQGIATGTFSQTLFSLADRIHDLGPGMQASKLATQAFGKAGQEMLPILLQGSEAIKKLQKSAVDAGLALDDKAVKGFKDAAKAADDLNDRWAAVERKGATALTPALLSISGSLSSYLDGVNNATQKSDIFSRSIDAITNSLKFWGDIISGTNSTVHEHADAVGMGTLRQLEYKQSLEQSAQAQAITAAEMDRATQGINFQTQSSARLTDQQRDLNDLWFRLQAGTAGNVASLREYSDATQAVVERDAELQRAATETALAQDRLSHSIDLVNASATHAPEAMDKAAKAQLGLKLATAGQKEAAAGDLAGAAAARQAAVADAEKTLAAQALFKAYDKGKLSLQQYIQAEQDLGKGNAAQVFFALKEAGIATDPALLKMEKDLRAVEQAAGVNDETMIAGLDTLRVVGGAYKSTTDAAGNYQKALVDNEVYQLQSNKTMADTREQYEKGAITVEQYAAAKVADSQADVAHRTALDAAKKAADNAGDGYVRYSKVVGEAAQANAPAAGSIKNVADALDLEAQKSEAAKTALDKLPDGKTITVTAAIAAGINAIQQVGLRLEELPSQKSIRLAAPVNQITVDLQHVWNALSDLPPTKTVAVTAAVGSVVEGLQHVGAIVAGLPSAKGITVTAAIGEAQTGLQGLSKLAEGLPKDARIEVTTAIKEALENLQAVGQAAANLPVNKSVAVSADTSAAASRLKDLNDRLDGVATTKTVTVGVNLPSEVGLHLFDGIKPPTLPVNLNLPPEVTLHLFDNAPPITLPSEATSHLFDGLAANPPSLPPEVTMHLFDNVSSGAGAIAGGITGAAGEISAGVAQGITATQQLAIDAMTTMATNMQGAFTNSWGIKSPSSVAAGYAMQIDAGLAQGVTSGMKPVMESFTGVKTSFTDTITAMVSAVREPAQWQAAGQTVDTTLAQSIRDNAGVITSALTDIINAAIKTSLAGIGVGGNGSGGPPPPPPPPGGSGSGAGAGYGGASMPVIHNHIRIGTREIKSELEEVIFEAVSQGAF